MGRKRVIIRRESVPNARYRKRHRGEHEIPSPQVKARKRAAVFLDRKSRG